MTLRHPVALTLAALLLAPLAEAEVSIDRGSMRVQARPGQTWAPMRPEALTSAVLNPYGDARGDGAPSIARAPVSEAWEAVWALGGADPGLAFARFDAEADGWATVRVPAARSASRLAGRTVSLHHDSQGNAFLVYDDPETGQVLVASVARDSLRVNPPMVLATPQDPGTSPDALWDGEELVVAFVRKDAPDTLEVIGIVPEWDADGRIPDGGEGIPGIPEPIFGHSTVPGALATGGTIGGGGEAPGLTLDSEVLDLHRPPAMLRIEGLGAGRLLVTWLHEERIYWAQRLSGYWTDPAWAPLSDPFTFEEARQGLADAFGGRIDPGSAREWDPDRRLPEAAEHRFRRR
jgi:hypothetical protein